MAEETCRLYGESPVREDQLCAMGGYTDGINTFDRTPKEFGSVMFHTLALAFRQATQ
jgi:hypothetical protein